MTALKTMLLCFSLTFFTHLPTAHSALITYSGNGRIRVTEGGPIADPGNFGVNNFPGHQFQFEFQIEDNPRPVIDTVPGRQTSFVGVAGSITILGETSPLTRMTAFFVDDFRFAGNPANPAVDQLRFLFNATFNGNDIGFQALYQLAPETFAQGGPTASPPVFAEKPVFRFSEVGRSRETHRYIFLTSPPGDFAEIPEEHTLTATATSSGPVVPEPSTFAIYGIGSVCLAASRYRKRRQSR